MNVSASALQCLPQEPCNVPRIQIRLYAFRQQFYHFPCVRNIPQRQELFCCCLEEFLLHLNSPQISVGIILAETAQAHAMKSVEQLIAGQNINIQILFDVPVVHGKGHVKPYTAQLVDDILKRHQVNYGVTVNIKSGQPLDVHA